VFLFVTEHLTDTKQTVIMKNKILRLCYFQIAKIDIDFMKHGQYESTCGKLKFVKKINVFSNVVGATCNLLLSSVAHCTLLQMVLFYHIKYSFRRSTVFQEPLCLNFAVLYGI
jgi:hypothetical protein